VVCDCPGVRSVPQFEFARDPLADVADAGHLAVQELVIRVANAAGWEAQFEAESRAYDSRRSIDVRLIDRLGRRIVIVECWNTFGDLGAATRSSRAKVRDEELHAVAIAGDGAPFEVGLVCVRGLGEGDDVRLGADAPPARACLV
jgi:hypothetical protein